jgi:hypothetical protein
MSVSLSRRQFIQAGAAFPSIVGAQDKAGTKRPVIGSGEYTYEVYHDWGELPSSIKYGNTHGVCQDSQGDIYIHHTVHATSHSSDAMVVFDAKGKFIRSWGAEYRKGAHGLHIRKEGSTEFLYLCDINRRIVTKTTLNGEVVFTLGYPEQAAPYSKAKIRYIPTNLAVAPNGDLYVADGYGSSYVNQYDGKGQYIRTFGGLGSEAGQLNNPHGIWMDTRGPEPILTVADRRNYRLQTFTLDGTHKGFVPGLRYPSHFHQRGELMVIPELEARVSILNGKNQIIAHFGQGPDNFREIRVMGRESFVPGQFVAPHSACFDHEGNIFVVEWVEVGRVTKLRKIV